jgi:hypothetical protein
MDMDVLRSIDGIAIFPVISLVLFVTVFTTMLIGAFRMDGAALRERAGMALDREDGRDRAEGERS